VGGWELLIPGERAEGHSLLKRPVLEQVGAGWRGEGDRAIVTSGGVLGLKT